MGTKSNRMYSKTPMISRGDDGFISVIRSSTLDGMGDLTGKESNGHEGQMPISVHSKDPDEDSGQLPQETIQHHERRDMYDRHASEVQGMTSRHQRESDVADHYGADKGMLSDKHIGEHADLHIRQLQEIKDMLSRHKGSN